jgi:hypothetical protein
MIASLSTHVSEAYITTGLIIVFYSLSLAIPVAERSKAWVCSRSPAGIAGSNHAECMGVCCECCVFIR